MNCPGCGASIFDASRACGRCGASLHVGSAPDDAQATTAWAHGFAQSQTSDTEPTESLAGFEADLPATRRRRRAWFVAGAAVIAAAVTAIVSFGTSVHGDVAKRTSVSATTSNSGSEANEWWTSAPLGERRDSVEVLAYGFPGIDERDLGRVFDVDLKPIAGAVPLFEVRPPKRVRRNEISKRLLRTWDNSILDGGVQFLFVGLDSTATVNHDITIYHSHEVQDVVALDETGRLRQPPPEAIFYLAEVHEGSCVDFLIEGDYSETGNKLSVLFTNGAGSMQDVEAHGNYSLEVKGLGIKDVTREGVFTMKVDDIAKNFRAEAAPIELVFRTIPGRTYQPKKAPAPITIADVPSLKLHDGASSSAWIVKPGHYRLVGTSKPNGLALLWGSANVSCIPDLAAGSEHTSVDSVCTVTRTTSVRVSNPSIAHDIADELLRGPEETMSVYIAKVP